MNERECIEELKRITEKIGWTGTELASSGEQIRALSVTYLESKPHSCFTCESAGWRLPGSSPVVHPSSKASRGRRVAGTCRLYPMISRGS